MRRTIRYAMPHVLPRAALALCAALFLPSAGPAQDSPASMVAASAPDVRGRPIVIFVHGRNQAGKTEREMQREWFDAFEDGLDKFGAKDLIAGSDRVLARYEWVYETDYEPSPKCGGVSPRPGTLLALRHDAQLAALDTFMVRATAPETMTAKERDEYDKSTQKAQRLALQLRDLVELRQALELAELSAEEQVAANNLTKFLKWLRKGAEKVIPPSLVTRFVADTRAYLSMGRQTCDTDARVREALDQARGAGRPVVLVVHSMGGMVTYHILHPLLGDAQRYDVRRYVSLGIQLGWESLPPYLIGTMAKSPYAVPSSVQDWVNFTGSDDLIGFPVGKTFHFPQVPGKRVRDVEVNTGKDPHDISQYLQQRVVATSIADAWCRAFTAPATKPAACTAVEQLAAGADGGSH